MPRPKKRRRASARPPASDPASSNLTLRALNIFLLHLGRTGPVTFAATRAKLLCCAGAATRARCRSRSTTALT